jgi:endonuclease YncB( thermonuclease family)
MAKKKRSNWSWRSLAIAFAACHITTTALAMELRGPATIIDGDTIEVKGQAVRLHGIDAAESGQRCITPESKIARPGKMATARLEALAKGGLVCKGTAFDGYGRLIATCRSSVSSDINRQLVREGLAWAFVKYATDYAGDEAKARDAGLGVWAMRCETPWGFREKRWTVNASKAPKGCAIKGNVSERGRIYHMPWNRSYARTSIDEARGERWFCDEADAIKAGWRAVKD